MNDGKAKDYYNKRCGPSGLLKNARKGGRPKKVEDEEKGWGDWGFRLGFRSGPAKKYAAPA